MTTMGRHRIIVLMAVGAFVLALGKWGVDSGRTEIPLTRGQQVEQCGSCHQREFENWRIGPHSHSYTMLIDHLSDIQDSTLFPREYEYFVLNKLPTCLGCHTGENLFETVLSDEELAGAHGGLSLALIRQDSSSWHTGVDCLTCHGQHDRVLARDTYVAGNPQVACAPVAKKGFLSNASCNPCHIYEEKAIRRNIELYGFKGETSCLRCHQEYDSDGRGTHYFFWRHDDEAGKQRPTRYSGVFDDLVLTVETRGDREVIRLSWQNSVMPHGFSECGEVMLVVSVASSESIHFLDTVVRLNRKIYHDAELAHVFPEGKVPGQVGHTFEMFDGPIVEVYPVPDVLTGPYSVSLTGKVKAQYWAYDKLGKVVFEDHIIVKGQ